MSEDNRASGSVKRREIKPKGERPQGDRSGQAGGRQPSQGAEGKSRQPRSGKGSGGQRRRPPQEGARKPQSQQDKDRGQAAAKPQAKPQARPETPAAAERTQGAPSQSRKKSGRNRRGPKRFPKDQDQAFRGEETVEDVVRDIRRIEKDIQIDLDSIRNQKLDL
ncbi:MAG: hypothetical protein WDA02_00595 [Saccharofermentanales bacterium]